MADLPAQPDPVTYGMGGLTSIDWAGPVKPLLDEIAQSTDYHLRVLGKEPAIPLMVSVYDKNMKIGEILRDIAWQCGRRATVAVYPEEQVIELRYAQN